MNAIKYMVKSHKHLYLVWCLGSVAFSGTMLMRLFHLLYLIALLYPGFQNNQLRLVLLEASIMLIRRWVYRIIKTVLFVKTKKLKGGRQSCSIKPKMLVIEVQLNCKRKENQFFSEWKPCLSPSSHNNCYWITIAFPS